jgi:hypothetical protein
MWYAKMHRWSIHNYYQENQYGYRFHQMHIMPWQWQGNTWQTCTHEKEQQGKAWPKYRSYAED